MIKKIVKGNLITLALEGQYNFIIHGCNCFCNMGAGIAKQIARQWPEVLEADKQTRQGDRTKLGKLHLVTTNDKIIVGNAYTQYSYGGGKKNVDYRAIKSVFENLNTLDVSQYTIGIPMIGAGLAGGDWDKISAIINTTTPNVDIDLVIL